MFVFSFLLKVGGSYDPEHVWNQNKAHSEAVSEAEKQTLCDITTGWFLELGVWAW